MTLTLNPAVDRSATVHGLIPSEKLRCQDEHIHPGGGGINVARMLKRLGADLVAVFPAAGPTGFLLTELAEADGISCEMIPVAGQTRENFSIRDTVSGSQYRFVFPGPATSSADIEKCCNRALSLAPAGAYLIASGSLPPGASPDTYASLARAAHARGIRLVVDCAGDALVQALGAGLDLVKVNEAELAGITGQPVHDREDCVAAAARLLETGARMVAVTRGAKGALLVTSRGAWEAAAPPVRALSTVGAGDSFLAGLVWSLASNQPEPEALRMGVAAGSAALLTEGTGLARLSDIARLSPAVAIRALSAEPMTAGA